MPHFFDIEDALASGITIDGIEYSVDEGNKNFIYAKTGTIGIVIAKTEHSKILTKLVYKLASS